MLADRLRFVILRHDHPYLHWDFLLEREQHDALESWRLLREPLFDEWVLAESLPDHRIAYLTYEGPVTGGRGSVSQVHSGTFPAGANGRYTASSNPSILEGCGENLERLRSVCLQVETGSTLSGLCTAGLFCAKDGRLFWMFRRHDRA